MNTTAAIPPSEKHHSVAAGIIKRFTQIAIGFVVEAAILFLAAGRLTWVWAWVYLAISLVSVAINGAFLLRTSPETVAERGQYNEMQDWDKIVSGLWSVAQYLLLPLVAGLDARFGWTPQLSAAWHGAGAVMLVAGLVL